MIWIARTFADQGGYDSARIWYQSSIDASVGLNQKEVGFALHGLASIDLEKGDYEAARENFGKAMKIVQQIGDRTGEAATWHSLGTINLKKIDYEGARENFGKAMKIWEQIGNLAGEALIWHQLAYIDLEKGDYEAARENFEKAMKIVQQIGDRVCEAATFHQLGFLAREQGRLKEGLRLVALSCVIDASIGHAETESDINALSGMASELKYTQVQIEAMLKEVAEAYKRDRGLSLIQAAFSKD